MKRFILLNNNKSNLINQIEHFFKVEEKIELDNNLIVLYIENTLIDDVLMTIKSLVIDLLSKDIIYISGSKNNLEKELDLVINNIKYLDKGVFVSSDLISILPNKLEGLEVILGNYYNDHNFNLLLETFFTNNLQVLPTANILYLHRNTLLYKLNNIYEHTGFNLKKFKDSALLYVYYLN